jgi:nucleoside 2-deoxyribosyltransferase
MAIARSKQKKVFFAGSIRGGSNYSSYYKEILDYLMNYCVVISEHLDKKTTGTQAASTADEHIYARDVGWIRESDVLVAEVTQPSVGVGYEIAYAEAHGKPVLALYCLDADTSISAMIFGNPYITTITYKHLDQLWPPLHKELSAILG